MDVPVNSMETIIKNVPNVTLQHYNFGSRSYQNQINLGKCVYYQIPYVFHQWK